MDFTEKTISVSDKYSGRIIYVHVDKVRLPDGSTSTREVVEHSGGVTVIPVDENGDVYCVRQYRYAFGEEVLETPAGKLEKGEDPFECAQRELSEETGFSAENWIYLGSFYPSPGYCKEILHAYLATGLKKGEAHLDEGEFLTVEKHSLSELCEMAMQGDIYDAKTIIAVLKADRYLRERREDNG